MLSVVLSLAVCSLPRGLHAQSDNFNDGDDVGWTRVSPLEPFGVPGVFTFPNGDGFRITGCDDVVAGCGVSNSPNGLGYRMQTLAASPSYPVLGAPRAYSLREDVSYADFYASVDLVDWNDA